MNNVLATDMIQPGTMVLALPGQHPDEFPNFPFMHEFPKCLSNQDIQPDIGPATPAGIIAGVQAPAHVNICYISICYCLY